MSGSFTISRCLWDDAAFQDEPFSEREAWIWMIAEAKWKPQEKRVGSVVVNLDRGQLAHSTRFLSDAWKWSHSKTRRFLERLENRHMICREIGTGVSVITICKYSEYQLSPEVSGTATAQKEAQQRHGDGTNLNKENKGNKDEEGKQELAQAPAKRDPVLVTLTAWASEAAATSFIAYRKRSKAKALTETAAKRLAESLQQIFNAGGDCDDALGMAEERGWQTVKADWYFNEKGKNNGQPYHQQNGGSPQRPKNRLDPALERLARLAGVEEAPGDGFL